MYKLYSQIWYVVTRVLLDTSSHYEVTAGSIATRLRVGRSGARSLVRAKIFLSYTTSRPAMRAHPDSYSMGVMVLSPGVMRSGHEFNHLPPTSREVKNVWSYISTPPIFLHSVDRKKITFTLTFTFSPTQPCYIYLPPFSYSFNSIVYVFVNSI